MPFYFRLPNLSVWKWRSSLYVMFAKAYWISRTSFSNSSQCSIHYIYVPEYLFIIISYLKHTSLLYYGYSSMTKIRKYLSYHQTHEETLLEMFKENENISNVWTEKDLLYSQRWKNVSWEKCLAKFLDTIQQQEKKNFEVDI